MSHTKGKYDGDLSHYVNVRIMEGEEGKTLIRENRREMFKALVVTEKENKELKNTIKTLIKRHQDDS